MTNSETPQQPLPSDPRPLFAAALDQAGTIVAAVKPEQLGLPTPCDDYDVRTLLGHLDAVLRRVGHVARGGHPFEVPSVIEEVGNDSWAARWAVDRAALDLELADDALLGRTLTLPWGQLPGAGAIVAYCGEMTTHGWDLATAIGRTDLLDDSLAEFSAAMARRFVPADPRGGEVPFAPVVPVADNAPPYERLAGWMGRDPTWAA